MGCIVARQIELSHLHNLWIGENGVAIGSADTRVVNIFFESVLDELTASHPLQDCHRVISPLEVAGIVLLQTLGAERGAQ
jgi:hypothetical protein